MIWVVLSTLCVATQAASLNSAYLPPANAKDAGGRDEDLQVPLEPPYVDPYSDNRHVVSDGDQPQYGRGYPSRGYRPRKERPRSFDWDQKFVDIPAKSRFLYGSYSYTGPDNVLVTVTYTADAKRGKGRKRIDEGDYDDYDSQFGGYGFADDDDDYFGPLEGGVVPTPPSLPKELQKAFAFHRRNYDPERKDDAKGTASGRRKYHKKGPPQKPVIHQGYSYPRNSTF